MKVPFSSVKHICQATRCTELRNQMLTDGKHAAAEFWTKIRKQKLRDAEVEKHREDLRERATR